MDPIKEVTKLVTEGFKKPGDIFCNELIEFFKAQSIGEPAIAVRRIYREYSGLREHCWIKGIMEVINGNI